MSEIPGSIQHIVAQLKRRHVLGAAGVATARELRTHHHPEAAADALLFANDWYDGRTAEGDGDPPSPQALADLAYVAGDMDRALERLEPLDLRESGVFATRLRGTIAALLGDTATAEEALARLDAGSTADVMGRHTFACAVVAYFLGRDEKALELLGTARERGYDVTTALHLEPDLAQLAEKAKARGAPAPEDP